MHVLFKLVSPIVVGLCVLSSANSGSAAFTAHLAEPRCISCVLAQRIAQELDCRGIAGLRRYGGCSGFCRGFAEGAVSQEIIAKCISDCNSKVAQCNGGGGGQPNCQWYSKGDIKKYICRIY
jgi:hypothetical protein